MNNKDLTKDEKLNLALKYQIFTEDASLFAELEFSEKITEETKLKVLGDKENNIIIKQIEKSEPEDCFPDDCCCCYIPPIYKPIEFNIIDEEDARDCDDYKNDECDNDPFGLHYGIGEDERDCDHESDGDYKSGNPFHYISSKQEKMGKEENDKDCNFCDCNDYKNNEIDGDYNKDPFVILDDIEDENNDVGGDGKSYHNNNCKSSKKEEIKEKEEENKKLEYKEFELNNKDNIMKMINTQDFIEGCWEENEYTKIIKEKYKKEYEILKGLTDKNIDDKTSMTILIIYFINKEHSELLNDLIMIIKKANLYIQKITKDKYENIIKEIDLDKRIEENYNK